MRVEYFGRLACGPESFSGDENPSTRDRIAQS